MHTQHTTRTFEDYVSIHNYTYFIRLHYGTVHFHLPCDT